MPQKSQSNCKRFVYLILIFFAQCLFENDRVSLSYGCKVILIVCLLRYGNCGRLLFVDSVLFRVQIITAILWPTLTVILRSLSLFVAFQRDSACLNFVISVYVGKRPVTFKTQVGRRPIFYCLSFEVRAISLGAVSTSRIIQNSVYSVFPALFCVYKKSVL